MGPLTRRRFLRGTVAGASLVSLAPWRAIGRKVSPNEKLNIGVIGVANQGAYDLGNVTTENIVALCDVDANYLDSTAQKFPQAKKYRDFRKMLEQKDIDAVVIATPDHTHAVATVATLKSGRHVYCEKPLTHTLSECRVVMETTRKTGLVTQMGTQIHAGNNYRRVVELVQAGAVGKISEVHVWVNATYGGKDLPTQRPPVPPTLEYDLWLGPAASRPYSPEYLPFNWRNWWAFGGGALSDFGCHFMDLPHWALKLPVPLSAEVVEGPPVHPESTPPALALRYEYPGLDGKSKLPLTWYHGGKQPPAEMLPKELAPKWVSGVLFIGADGMLLSDYDRHLLLPEKKFAGFTPPAPTIPNSIGHHAEWINACKTGGKTTCNFAYSGALTEAVLLGNLAYRLGKKIDWDSRRLEARHCPEAAALIHHHYRDGWKVLHSRLINPPRDPRRECRGQSAREGRSNLVHESRHTVAFPAKKIAAGRPGHRFSAHHPHPWFRTIHARAQLEIRPRHPGRTGGDCHPRARQLLRQRMRERKHKRLARVIDRHVRPGLERGHRGNIKNPPFSPPHHRRGEQPA